jgi:hypothetical protein
VIARACYVQCDRCGNPAGISTDGAVMARRYARINDGFTRVEVDRGLRHEDVCPRCQSATSEGEPR